MSYFEITRISLKRSYSILVTGMGTRKIIAISLFAVLLMGIISFDDAFAQKPVKEEKVTICHIPPGNPDNIRTITVDESAVPAHLAHGDYVGECVPLCESDLDCNDNNMCTANICDRGNSDADLAGCVVTPVNPDDNNLCTVDSCDPTTGISNTPVNPDDNNLCTVDSCDPTTGISNTPVNPDDNNLCTTLVILTLAFLMFQ
jgi:hypothetical protein